MLPEKSKSKFKFTDRALKAIKPTPEGKRIFLWDAATPGFAIRVGHKSNADAIGDFYLVRRFPGQTQPSPRKIGPYPAMTLAEAHAKAREWNDDVRNHVDPAVKLAEKRRDDEARRHDTFAAALGQYADEVLSTPSFKTGAAVAHKMRTNFGEKIGSRPLSEITRSEINTILKTKAKSAPSEANHLTSYVKTFFKWCVNEEKIAVSPIADLGKPSKTVTRDRKLTDDEIRWLWKACRQDPTDPFARVLLLLLVLGQRKSEVSELVWRELDLEAKLWTIPKNRTKSRREHVVPLSRLALELIGTRGNRAPSHLLFPSDRPKVDESGQERPIPLSGWSKALPRIQRAAVKIADKELVKRGQEPQGDWERWTIHDLRRTCASKLGKLRVNPFVIERVLNHARKGVTNTAYNQHDYLDEKARALEAWAMHLRKLVGEPSAADNVIAISPQRSIA